jgi:uncharacterized protein YjbJ (UPF0337 family)
MKTNLKILLLIPILSIGFSACDKTKVREENSEKMEKAREAATDSPGALKVKGNWNVLKGKIKQKYGQLTDDDVIYEKGKEDELYGRLEKRLGKSRKEVDQIIEGL